MKHLLVTSLMLLLGISAALAQNDISQLRMAELKNLLIQDCGSCHGLLLKGGLGPELSAARLGQLPAEYITNTILNGHPGTAMPPWKAILSESEARWITTLLQQGDLP